MNLSAGGILSPVPGDLQRDRGPCDYDVRHNFTASYVYQLPVKLRGRLGTALNGWQVSGTFFWHSGIPFSVLSAPYSANGNGIVNGSGAQFASVAPGVPLYAHNPIPGAFSRAASLAAFSCCALSARVSDALAVLTIGNNPKKA